MFSIFHRKKNISGLDWLSFDMHSHLLPGIDDGATDVKTALELIAGLKSLGIRSFVTTPHIFKEMYPNNRETIASAHQSLVDAAPQVAAQIGFAAEYMLDDDFEKLLQEPLLCISGNQVLIEMSYLYESPRIDEFIFELQLKGYQPILAHPERYRFYHGKMSKLKGMRDRGVLFQVNLLSLCGYYGKAEKNAALELSQANMIDYAGTDLHNINHLQALQEGSQDGVFYRHLQVDQLKNHALLGIDSFSA